MQITLKQGQILIFLLVSGVEKYQGGVLVLLFALAVGTNIPFSVNRLVILTT